jgi:hypothetical protein
VLKKDRDDTEGWGAFAGTGGKKKGKGGYKKTAVPAATAATESAAPAASVSNNNISLPFSTLNTLLGFGISPPANKDDVPRVIEDLSTKKSWFEANQKRKTEEEVERVEKQINKMLKKSGGAGAGEGAEDEGVEVEGKETGGEREPNHSEPPFRFRLQRWNIRKGSSADRVLCELFFRHSRRRYWGCYQGRLCRTGRAGESADSTYGRIDRIGN